MATAQALLTKEYETIYILRADVDADTAEKVQTRVSEVVERETGKLLKVESWGRRKLAYPIGKQRRGVYMYVKYVGRGGLVTELERNLKLQDAVVKFQTVLLAEKVDMASVQVDPEEVKLQRLELPPEAEEIESREKALGLVDFGESPKAAHKDRSEDDFDGEDFDGDDAGTARAAAAPAAAAAAAAAPAAAAPAAAAEKPTPEGDA